MTMRHARIWLVIAAVNTFTPEASKIVEARAPRVTAELLAAVNERRLLLAELMAPSPAEPPKAVPPKRRSDPELVNSALQRAVRGEVSAYWGRKPNVSVFVHRI